MRKSPKLIILDLHANELIMHVDMGNFNTALKKMFLEQKTVYCWLLQVMF